MAVQKEQTVILEMKILKQFGFVISFDCHQKLMFIVGKLKSVRGFECFNEEECVEDVFRIFNDLFMCPSVVNCRIEEVVASAIMYRINGGFRNQLIEELINLYDVFRVNVDPYD